MPNIYFIADLHFGHENVILYENRPYADADEMDADLIKRWNAVVKNDSDIVYFLGDFLFGSFSRAEKLLSQLNGQKLLIRGNHDFRKSNEWWINKGFHKALTDGYSKEAAYLFSMDGTTLLLSHFPLNNPEHFNVHGHVHTHIQGIDPTNHLCISVEQINYQPISWEELKRLILKLKGGE